MCSFTIAGVTGLDLVKPPKAWPRLERRGDVALVAADVDGRLGALLFFDDEECPVASD